MAIAAAIALNYRVRLRWARKVVLVAMRKLSREAEHMRKNLIISFACSVFRRNRILEDAMSSKSYPWALEIQKDLDKLLGLLSDQKVKPKPILVKPQTAEEMTNAELAAVLRRAERAIKKKKGSKQNSACLSRRGWQTSPSKRTGTIAYGAAASQTWVKETEPARQRRVVAENDKRKSTVCSSALAQWHLL